MFQSSPTKKDSFTLSLCVPYLAYTGQILAKNSTMQNLPLPCLQTKEEKYAQWFIYFFFFCNEQTTKSFAEAHEYNTQIILIYIHKELASMLYFKKSILIQITFKNR